MKNFLLNIIFFVCYLPITIYSQVGAIEGSISSNSNAVAFANIGLSGTKLGTAADINGKFKLNNIPVGTYTVQVSSVGYKNYKKTITIESGRTITLNITLDETATQIEEFVVTGTLREVSIKESAVPIKVYLKRCKLLMAFVRK